MSAVSDRTRAPEPAAVRLERIIAHIDAGYELLSCGQVSAGKVKIERALEDLKNLATDEFGRGARRRSRQAIEEPRQ